jgi:hypothetical protein
MTITNGYATLAQLKSADRLNISTADTVSDTNIEAIITACSRAIDLQCGRYFYKSSTSETRYFTAIFPSSIFVGDVVSISALATDDLAGSRSYSQSWTTTDYDLFPYEADSKSEPEPFRFIDCAPSTTLRFSPRLAKGVKVTGIFGWASVPIAISEACIIWAERVFKRSKTPLGVSGNTAIGSMTASDKPDPDVDALIYNYRVVAV